MTNGTNFIDAVKLVSSPKTKVVDIPEKGQVKVRALTFGEIIDIRGATKGDTDSQTVGMIMRGLLEPKLTIEQVKKLSPNEIAIIADAIAELSLSKDAIERGKKWLGQRRVL